MCLGIVAKNCKVCLFAGRKTTKPVQKRKVLGEPSTNTTMRVKIDAKRRELTPRSRFGCGLCQIYLCHHKRYWNEHIGAI